ARRGLRLRLEKHDRVEIVGECENGRTALQSIIELAPDLVFLDIQMPGMSGFDVIGKMQPEDMPLVIFVTAFDEFAVEAFEVNAIDYLLKPVDDERLAVALERARQHLDRSGASLDKQRLLEIIIGLTGRSESSVARLLRDHTAGSSYPERLAIKDGGETVLVSTGDIDWVDAAGDYMCIHAAGETHIMRITMKQLEDRLDPSIFQRVHRSTIVNIRRVDKICTHMNGEFYLTLNDGTSIKMSRSYKDKVQHFL
ncbi:MAG TPA: LytTR family DNA-binding domain-containing protein, partial [Pseudomonadales bacterium]|nr:LytTR family DNA-binding domain-containing protein [Pseudomonadales bacterium]